MALERIGRNHWNVDLVQRRIQYGMEVEPNPDIRAILKIARDLIDDLMRDRLVQGASAEEGDA